MGPHAKKIAEIVAEHPGAKTTLFREKMREALRPSMIEEWEDHPGSHEAFEEGIARDLWMRPDAYLIVPKAKLVICWEVEYRHRYKDGKYNLAFWLLDEFYWTLKVITVDAVYGSQKERDIVNEVYVGLEEVKAESLAQ